MSCSSDVVVGTVSEKVLNVLKKLSLEGRNNFSREKPKCPTVKFSLLDSAARTGLLRVPACCAYRPAVLPAR